MLNKILCITVFLILVLPIYSGVQLTGLGVFTFQKVAVILMLLLFIITVFTKALKFTLPSDVTAYVLLQLILFLFTIVSLFTKSDPQAYGQTLFYSTLIFSLVFFATISVFNNTSSLKFYKSILICAYVVIIVVAFFEIILGNTVVQFFMISDTDFIQKIAEGKFRDGEYRVMSVFSNPLILSQYLLFFFPILILIILGTKYRYKYFLLSFMYVVSLYIQYKTYSRSGLMIMLLLPFLYYLMHTILSFKKGHKHLLLYLAFLSIFIFAITLPLVIDAVITKIYSDSEQLTSSLARVHQWEQAKIHILSSPLFGNGSGNSLFLLSDGLRSIDNYFITILLEHGFVGLLIRFLLLIILCNSLIKIHNSNHLLSVSLLVSLFMILVSYSAQSMPYGVFFICFVYLYYCFYIKESVSHA